LQTKRSTVVKLLKSQGWIRGLWLMRGCLFQGGESNTSSRVTRAYNHKSFVIRSIVENEVHHIEHAVVFLSLRSAAEVCGGWCRGSTIPHLGHRRHFFTNTTLQYAAVRQPSSSTHLCSLTSTKSFVRKEVMERLQSRQCGSGAP
jgi:hypothetical protein